MLMSVVASYRKVTVTSPLRSTSALEAFQQTKLDSQLAFCFISCRYKYTAEIPTFVHPTVQ
jgi:hypothetical protein